MLLNFFQALDNELPSLRNIERYRHYFGDAFAIPKVDVSIQKSSLILSLTLIEL